MPVCLFGIGTLPAFYHAADKSAIISTKNFDDLFAAGLRKDRAARLGLIHADAGGEFVSLIVSALGVFTRPQGAHSRRNIVCAERHSGIYSDGNLDFDPAPAALAASFRKNKSSVVFDSA